MAGPHIPAGDQGPRVTFEEAVSETHPSASALARAFGSTVLEPSWWPADVEEISYRVGRFSSGQAHYEIESIRRNGVPVGAIGHFAVAPDRSPRDWPDGEWSEPRELVHLRGLIGRVGIPPRLQAVIYDQGLEIQLIGYDTEDEVTTTVRSLRRVAP